MEEAFDDSGGSVHPPKRLGTRAMFFLTLFISARPASSVPLSPYSMPSLVSGSSGLGRGDIGGGGGRLVLENRHLHSPCNFNPRCLCSSGGEILKLFATGLDSAGLRSLTHENSNQGSLQASGKVKLVSWLTQTSCAIALPP